MQRNILLAEIVKRRRICVAAAVIILIKNEENKRNHRSRPWVHSINQNRVQQGQFNNLIQEMKLYDKSLFFDVTRMSIAQFDYLQNLVEYKIKKVSRFRETIPPGVRLAITLRHLSTGDSLASLAHSFKIAKSTTCRIIKETCGALWEVLSPVYLKFPSTPEEWKDIAVGYDEQWNLPHCIGAIDGKHVIQFPNKTGSQYFNYKNNFSIVLFAICDANYNFIYVDIGAYGSQSDGGGVLRESAFGHKLFNNELNLPDSDSLSSTNIDMPYFFVGDKTFPLHKHLLRPYGDKQLPPDKKIFNYRLTRARKCIENAFGILVSRFGIFHRVIDAYPETVNSIIKASVCLHNYIKTMEERDNRNKNYCQTNYVDRYDGTGNLIPGEWRSLVPKNAALENTSTLQRRIGTRNATKEAESYRDKVKDYINSNQGKVPWQDSII